MNQIILYYYALQSAMELFLFFNGWAHKQWLLQHGKLFFPGLSFCQKHWFRNKWAPWQWDRAGSIMLMHRTGHVLPWLGEDVNRMSPLYLGSRRNWPRDEGVIGRDGKDMENQKWAPRERSVLSPISARNQKDVKEPFFPLLFSASLLQALL